MAEDGFTKVGEYTYKFNDCVAEKEFERYLLADSDLVFDRVIRSLLRAAGRLGVERMKSWGHVRRELAKQFPETKDLSISWNHINNVLTCDPEDVKNSVLET